MTDSHFLISTLSSPRSKEILQNFCSVWTHFVIVHLHDFVRKGNKIKPNKMELSSFARWGTYK